MNTSELEGIQGFGAQTQEDVDGLNKALSAGYDNPPTTGGGVLRVQSLEATLKIVTFMMEHIRMWKIIPKLPAYSTVEEYNRLVAYGNESGGFFNSGGLPEVEDTQYARQTQLVKFLGTQREVTHPLTLVRPAHGDVIALETQNGTMFILNKLERGLFYGDSDKVTQEFDGIDRQISVGAPGNVIDLMGNSLTEADLEQGANVIIQNFGVPTHMHLSTLAMSDLAKTFYPKERYTMPAPTNGQVGMAVTTFASQGGLISFEPNVFIQPGGAAPTSATSTKAPNAPTVLTGAVVADATSNLAAGTYKYGATAVNQYGESAVLESAAVVVAAVGNRVDVSITDGGGSFPATAYKVYRRLSSGVTADLRYFITVKNTVTDPEVVADRNFNIPGTSKAWMIQGNVQNYAFKQLAPLMRLPLATIAASYRWLQLLYGTPIVYTPTKNVIYKNIGSLDTRAATAFTGELP